MSMISNGIVTCQGRGVPRPEVFWYKDGARIPTNKTMMVHQDVQTALSRLVIKPNATTRLGSFLCVARSETHGKVFIRNGTTFVTGTSNIIIPN